MTVDSINSPEMQLLLQCARTRTELTVAERIESLVQGRIDWPRICHLAARHGIQPLFCRNLAAICPDAVPHAVADRLRAASRLNVARSLYQAAELHRVFSIFGQGDLRAIAFKGPTLGHWAYGDPGLRESGDLDIVIHEQDMLTARELLRAHNYQERSEPLGEETHDTCSQRAPRYNVFVHKESRIIIDLQHSLEGPHFSFPLNDRELWARAGPREFFGRIITSFCRDDLLILLSVHGTKDVWHQLKWVCDLAELMQADGAVDWKSVLGRASRLHARRMLLLGTFLAHQLLGANLPAGMLREVRKSRSLVASAEAIMSSFFVAERNITTTERVMLYVRTDDGAWARAGRLTRCLGRYLRVIFVPSESDRQSVQLPDWLSFGYYVFRPIRLLLKYAVRPRLLFRTLRDWSRSFR